MPTNVLSNFLQGFGAPDRLPTFQPPASVAEQKEKLDRQLTILEKLKAQRLAAQLPEPDESKRSASRTPSTARSDDVPSDEAELCFCYDVVRHRGHWRVRHIGKHIGTHPNPKAAVKAAVKLATTKQKAGHRTQIRLHRTDGQIVDISTSEE